MAHAKDLTPKDPEFVTSIQRGLQVLGVFDREHPELTLNEVARRSKLSPATARRFLLTFKTLGYIGISGRTYFLRPKILDLAHAYLATMRVDEVLQPFLREIVQRTGDSSSVTVMDGTDIFYIANASVRRLVRLGAGVGSRFPAYPTSMGRVLLAYKSPACLDYYFQAENLRRFTEFTETNEERLRQILMSVRADGYAVVQDELEVGLVSIAVPIWGPAGTVIAAMNCASVARRTDSQEMLRTRLGLLKEFSQEVSVALARFPSFANSIGVVDTAVQSDSYESRLDNRKTTKRRSTDPDTALNLQS
jgi:IclR family pca regulon transcriptional regulator